MKMKTWHVTLHGKWGGVRSVEVEAGTKATARKRGRERAQSFESVSDVREKVQR